MARIKSLVAVTTQPTDGSVAWQETSVHAMSVTSLSCARPSFCALATYGGWVYTTSDPAGLTPTWTSSPNVDGYTPVTDVSCASAKLCLAADGAGRTFTSVKPTGGAAAWRPAYIDGTNLVSNINCPAVSFCAAVSNGNLLTSADPAGGKAGDWQLISVPSGLTDLSCQTPSFCAGVDGAGLLISAAPADGASAWQQGSTGTGLTSLSCPNSHLCAGIVYGHDYEVVTTTDPTATAPQLNTTDFGRGYGLDKLYCPSASRCFAVGQNGGGQLYFFSSTDPTGGISAWRVSKAPAVGRLACPSASECIVWRYDPQSTKPGGREMFVTTDPGATTPSWRESPAPIDLSSVSCPAASFCAAAYLTSNETPSFSGGIRTATPAGGT